MRKTTKRFFKKLFFKNLIEEQKIIKIVQKAHKKEQRLLNKLLEENCDNQYITNQINDLMQNEILKSIKKYFPTHEVFFEDHPNEDIFVNEEETIEEVKKQKKKLFKKEEIQTKIEVKTTEEVDENEKVELPKVSNYWLITVLSGYMNDKNRISNYATSLCYVKDGVITMSVVFDWYKKDVYFAVKGKGAYLNYQKIRVSQNESLKDTIVSFRLGPSGLNDNIELEKALAPNLLKMQTFSNIALEMCFVASGKIDACIDVSVCDLLSYRIGKLICEEAGGKVTNFSGESYKNSTNIIATNNVIHQELMHTIKSKLVGSSLKKVWRITTTALRIVATII